MEWKVSFIKLNQEHFPLLHQEFPIFGSCQKLASLWFSIVLSIVETDWKLTPRFLLVRVVGYEQVTASEYRSSFRVVGNSKLREV